MILWLLFALMTVAAIAAVLWPLTRRNAARGGSDIAVYRDQLDEITRDRAAGLIGESEAEAAKVEVSRRLLAAADAAAAEKSADDESSLWRRPATASTVPACTPSTAMAAASCNWSAARAISMSAAIGRPWRNTPGW